MKKPIEWIMWEQVVRESFTSAFAEAVIEGSASLSEVALEMVAREVSDRVADSLPQ